MLKNLMVLFILLIGFGADVKAQQKSAKHKPVKSTEPETIEVYRSASCGCCGKWLEHLANSQFKVIEHLLDDVKPVKNQYGVPVELASCHTALVGGYVIEGHVPSADIRKLLTEKPKVAGLTVPQMPIGTPGMEMDGKQDAYQVLSFGNNQVPAVFNSYPAK